MTRLDNHSRDVLSGAALAFGLRVIGAGLAFILNVVAARLLGAEGAGLYFLALSITMVGSVVARMGMESSLLRFVSSRAAKGDWGEVKGVFLLGARLAGCTSLVLAVICAVSAEWLAESVFDEPKLAEPLKWASFGIVTFSIQLIVAESLKGIKRVRDSMLVSSVLYPLIALLFIWPSVAFMGAAGANFSYVASTAIASLVGLLAWFRVTGKQSDKASEFPLSLLWKSCRSMWVATIVNRAVIVWGPLLLLGIWSTTEDVGVFGAVTRISTLISFFLLSINTVLAPKIAEFHHRGDNKNLARLATRFALMATVAASPMFILLIGYGNWVMGTFGSDFERGGFALAILSIGQVVSSLTGIAPYVLTISGHETDLRNASLISALVLVVLFVALVPLYGINGAAVATSVATSLACILNVYHVKRRVGVLLVPFLGR